MMSTEDLVRREIVPGETTLGQLGALTDARSWLDDRAVTVVDAVFGKLPVAWPTGGTVATVALPGGRPALYLALGEELGTAEVASGLRGDPGAERAAGAVILDSALVAVLSTDLPADQTKDP